MMGLFDPSPTSPATPPRADAPALPPLPWDGLESSPPAAVSDNAGEAIALRRELAMERARRHVYESVARDELLTHTVQCLVDMIERESPRLSAAILFEPDLGDLTVQGVTGRLGEPLLVAASQSIGPRSSSRAAAIENLQLSSPTVSALAGAINLDGEAAWASVAASLGSMAATAHAIPIAGTEDRPSDADPNAPQKSVLLGTLILTSAKAASPTTAAMMAATSGPTAAEAATFDSSERALIELAVELAAFAINHRHRAARAEHRLLHDDLTGLPNSMLLQDRLSQAAEVSRRQETQLAVLVADVDGLRAINETSGRQAGDDVLRQLARRLQKNLRRCDTIARSGGDKFALVAQVANGIGDLAILARKVLSIVSTPVRVGDREVSLAANVGISLFPTDGDTAACLIDTAEVAAHRSKREGHNTFQFFRPTADAGEKSLADLELRGQLRKALEGAIRRQRTGQSCNEEAGLLELHYQPQVDSEGRIVGVEALARWTHPTFGRIPPDRFIALAEDSGLIVSFGEWAMREAATQVRAWRQTFGPRAPRVAVNVSALQFADNDFTDIVERLLAEAPWSPGWLELEITETVLMADAEEAARKVARLRAMGLSVALDDFGTGYSSLSYLHQLTLDTLKVDRSFVMALPGSDRRGPATSSAVSNAGRTNGTAVIRAIISMGKSLGMTVLAEGVETEAQRRMLGRLGCDQMQGYLFSRPVPPSEIESLLAQESTLPITATLAAAVA